MSLAPSDMPASQLRRRADAFPGFENEMQGVSRGQSYDGKRLCVTETTS